MRISEIRIRQIGTVKPRHAKISLPKIGLPQGCAIQEGAAEPGRPEIRIIQTRPPKAGAAKVRVAEIGFAQIGVI